MQRIPVLNLPMIPDAEWNERCRIQAIQAMRRSGIEPTDQNIAEYQAWVCAECEEMRTAPDDVRVTCRQKKSALEGGNPTKAPMQIFLST